LGAFVNNLIQLSILVFLLKNRFVLYQLPYFSILGTVSGTVNAFIAYEMGRRIP
ncbi:MAG: Gx transporter family protein, partial [Thermotogae bacterium]|nr:Gx transporter family protein [Thermotogota bacterium]